MEYISTELFCFLFRKDMFMEERLLDRNRFEYYWSYYLSVEKMLEDTRKYVAVSEENKDTYSDEFAKIILLSCSEIDSILKLICKLRNIQKEDNQYNMKVYIGVLNEIENIKEIAYSRYPTTCINEELLIVRPFKTMDINKKYGGMDWWEAYQSLKHNRLENALKGNLNNAVTAVAAQYIIIRLLIDFLNEYDGMDYVKEHNVSEYFIPCI